MQSLCSCRILINSWPKEQIHQTVELLLRTFLLQKFLHSPCFMQPFTTRQANIQYLFPCLLVYILKAPISHTGTFPAAGRRPGGSKLGGREAKDSKVQVGSGGGQSHRSPRIRLWATCSAWKFSFEGALILLNPSYSWSRRHWHT